MNQELKNTPFRINFCRPRARRLSAAAGALAVSVSLALTTPAAGVDDGTTSTGSTGSSQLESLVARTEVPDDWRTTETENGWALPVEYLGWGSALVATSDDASFDLPVPFAAGHRLDSIEFTAELSDHVPGAAVSVAADGEVFTEIELSGSDAVAVRIEVPSDVTARSTISIRLVPSHRGCPIGPLATVGRLATPTFFFRSAPVSASSPNGGLRTPDAVAGVQFVVDDSRSTAVDQSVLAATAAFARQFPGEQRFSVIGATEPGDDTPPFVTQVRIRERDEAVIVGDTIDERFVVTGRADDLATQASGLVEAIRTLDAIDEVTIDGLTAPTGEAPERIPVEDLTSRLRVQGAYHLEVPIVLEQADFGLAVSSYRVRLGGVVSPAESSGTGTGQLGLWVGDEILEVVEVDENGRFDIETTVTGERVERTTVLRLALDLQVANCLSGEALTLQVDRGSWVQASAGQTAAPGFGRFPQVFGPGLAVDPGATTSQLATAADTVGLFQDMTTTPLVPVVIGRDELTEAGPSLLVGADIELLDQLGAPVNGASGRIETSTATIANAADSDLPTSAMQAFVSTGGSDVLAVDVPGAETWFGLPDSLSVRRFRQLDGAVLYLDPDDLIEVSGLSIERTIDDEDASVALASLDDEVAGGRPTELGGGMARRELFAMGMAGTILLAGMATFGRRSVRSAARVDHDR